MQLSLRVTGNRVLIKPHVPKIEMPAGLIAPDISEPFAEVSGEVVQISRMCDSIPEDFRVGDTVFFSPTVGQGLVYDEVSYLIMRPEDVLAKVVT